MENIAYANLKPVEPAEKSNNLGPTVLIVLQPKGRSEVYLFRTSLTPGRFQSIFIDQLVLFYCLHTWQYWKIQSG